MAKKKKVEQSTMDCIGRIGRGALVTFAQCDRGMRQLRDIRWLQKKSCPGCPECEMDKQLVQEAAVRGEVDLGAICGPHLYRVVPVEGKGYVAEQLTDCVKPIAMKLTGKRSKSACIGRVGRGKVFTFESFGRGMRQGRDLKWLKNRSCPGCPDCMEFIRTVREACQANKVDLGPIRGPYVYRLQQRVDGGFVAVEVDDLE